MKRRTIRVSAAVGILLAVFLMSTAFVCTSAQQTQASKYADSYAQSLKSIHDAVDSALVSGKLTPAEKQNAYKALLKANEAGLHINSAIRAVAAATGPVSAVQAAIAEASSAIDDGTASIKNPDTLAIVKSLAASAKAILGQIAEVYVKGA